MEMKIKMISAASKVLEYLRRNSYATDEELFQHLLDYIVDNGIKKDIIIRGMIATATKTIKIKRKDPRKTEKQILSIVMSELPIIENGLEETN